MYEGGGREGGVGGGGEEGEGRGSWSGGVIERRECMVLRMWHVSTRSPSVMIGAGG